MRTRAVVAITVLTSVLASAAIVGGVRLIQHLASSDFVTTAVTVDLPGARARPEAAVLALHASTLTQGRATVSARKHATGLVSVISRDGSLVGEAILPNDPLLRRVSVTVNYQSTAASLVLESPALITSSPLLSALIMSESRRSPAVGRLADALRSEATARTDYLTHPDSQLLAVLGVAEHDVAARVRQDFAGATGGSGGDPPSASRPPSDPGPGSHPAPPTHPAPPSNPAPSSAPVLLPDQIVLPDTIGQTACSTHSVTAALCLEHTYPLTLASPELNGTDWSAGWQMLFLSSQLTPGQTGLALPFALLPPVVNAPPTISGLITTVVQTGVSDALQNPTICRQMQGDLVLGSLFCNQPSGRADLGSALLSQLTLAGSSQAVHIALTRQLQQQPVSAVGFGIAPGPSASPTEVDARWVSMAMSIATELVIPAVQLVLDARAVREGLTAKSADKETTRLQEEASSVQTQATRLEEEIGPTPTSLQRASARLNVDKAESAVTAAQAKLVGEEQKLANAAPPSRGGYQRAVNLYRAQLAEDQRVLNVAQAIETSYDLHDQRAAELGGQLSRLREQGNAVQRQADLAAQRGRVATGQGLISELFAQLLALVDAHQKDLACAYNAVLANNPSAASSCLKPVLGELVSDAGVLLPLATNDALQLGEGFLVSHVLFALFPPLAVVDLVSNAFGFAQDVVDLVNTSTIPDRHDFAAIDTNYRRGSTLDQLATLYLGAIPSQALALGPAGLAADAAVSKLTGQAALFVTSITTVCPDTVIVPDAYVHGRLVGIVNLSNLADWHLAGGFGAVKRTAALGGAVPFAVVQSATPLGSGGASLADPPAMGSTVHVVNEGAGLLPNHYRTFDGRVSGIISLSGETLVELVDPGGGTPLAGSRGVGGFVFATKGRDAGQLVGLAEAEQGGKLVVLAGPGVADITAGIGGC